MAGSFSDYLEDEVLDHVFGGATYTPPATLYAQAYTATPSDSGGGTQITTNGHARVAITNNLTNFPAASGGAKSNGTAITWGAASGGSWGDVAAVGFFDASSGGNLIGWSDVPAAKTIDDGDVLFIPVGALTITLT